MKKKIKEIKEIPFGAKDSELYKFEYTIPEGYEARIENGKAIVRKKDVIVPNSDIKEVFVTIALR